jgi:hypothetical protein
MGRRVKTSAALFGDCYDLATTIYSSRLFLGTPFRVARGTQGNRLISWVVVQPISRFKRADPVTRSSMTCICKENEAAGAGGFGPAPVTAD